MEFGIDSRWASSIPLFDVLRTERPLRSLSETRLDQPDITDK
jgi:hypothetical protein